MNPNPDPEKLPDLIYHMLEPEIVLPMRKDEKSTKKIIEIYKNKILRDIKKKNN